ncbi:MAG: hypothetical protein AABZ45_03120 [Pseudomonadota bacterium]
MSVQALCTWDWQASATLTTGILAVGAALWVGKKQTGIQRRQIQLAENDLKIQLLDRRFDCIERIRQIRSAYVGSSTLSVEQIVEFFEVIRLAELIFPVAAVDNLRRVSAQLAQVEHFRRMGDAAQSRHDETARQQAITQENESAMAILDALPSLVDELVIAAKIDIA